MGSSSAGAPGSVIRTCVGCGRRAAKSDLLRVVAIGGEIVADPAARSPGRGAYLHLSLDCLERARRRRAIPRALRVTGSLADDRLVSYLAETHTAPGSPIRSAPGRPTRENRQAYGGPAESTERHSDMSERQADSDERSMSTLR